MFKSKAMQEIEELIDAMAPSEANVLITGESGVGKEVIANVIHSRSRRAAKPMVKLNCAAFPQAMIEGGTFRLRQRRIHRRDERFSRHDRGSDRQHLVSRRDFRNAGRICRRVFCASCRNANIDRSEARKTLKADFRVVAATNRPIARRWRKIGCGPIFIIG